MNSVVLIGRLTRDPEVRYTAGTQMAVCTFTVAIDRPVKDRQIFQGSHVLGSRLKIAKDFLQRVGWSVCREESRQAAIPTKTVRQYTLQML